ncbi:MAG: prolyl oligopeptidase family serine peptidase, partial [Pseudomonadota bacterium]|nr:prolyl oligopeptidase family serine peptidase [Pseudomonadota bacterium]
FHGSVGYGQAFTDAINRDWGGAPLQDLRLGLAAAARADRSIDTDNACALGGSYGGYMVNWIAGQWPDGFDCLVSHAGVFDLRAMAYETEELWFMEWEFGGPYFDPAAAEVMERWNPVRFVDRWRTPMLVIHGERDFRIPYSQSLAMFNALQRRGIPSRLLIYPDENHWILKPQNSIQWYREVHGWLDRWLRGGGGQRRGN